MHVASGKLGFGVPGLTEWLALALSMEHPPDPDPSPLSPALRDLRQDGARDRREDLRIDEISPLVFERDDSVPAFMGEPEDADEDIDPWDARDALAHRKKMAVWSLSKRRTAERSASLQELRPSLTTLKTDAILLRNAAIPNAVWTLGDSSHGQCGHRKQGTAHVPHPADLELQTLRDGVRSISAGPHCTLVVTSSGDALGFGSGPFRAAAEPPEEPPASELAREGVPPFRVSQMAGHHPAQAAGSSSTLPAQQQQPPSQRPPRPGQSSDDGGESGSAPGPSFDRTEEAVRASISRRAAEKSSPTALTGLLMPVEQVGLTLARRRRRRPCAHSHALALLRALTLVATAESRLDQVAAGEDFCIALMQNGLVFAWGDGEEGKLGLGQPTSHSRPTMVALLLRTQLSPQALALITALTLSSDPDPDTKPWI